ncbi:hypothetical protein [Brachybacterium paraconglomeratum]|uniref:hypothetical protein n=1 Tax=Brachybacterium paraconglomeratum TaxID=173362 RepID=UPI00223B8D09|nr:hypothetical protein [Brachybacterium paraconglomeratum]MCT1436730.1 hypothetical protein [Brachybacterium paraconglomeratum]
MLLIARASQDEILAAFAPLRLPEDPDRTWHVGPTAPSGWTAAWVEEETTLPETWDLVLLGEVGDPRVVRVRTGGAERRFAWDIHDASIPGEVPAAIAATLGMPGTEAAFRLALEEHLLGETTAEEEDLALSQVAEALGGARGRNGLPELENDTFREVLLDRGDASRRRDLAEQFFYGEEGWVLTEIGGDWFTVHSADTPELGAGPFDLDDASGEDQPVLVLWRGSGSGAVLEDREDLMELIQWNTGWVEQDDDSADRATTGEALVETFGVGEGARRLRDLCAVRTVDGDPLAQLLELLDIPRTALLVLDDDPSAPEPMSIDAPGGFLRGVRRLFGGRG